MPWVSILLSAAPTLLTVLVVPFTLYVVYAGGLTAPVDGL
jgi:hypothetical protein